MRYPLIDGQGNFGCFTGDTKIRLADGSSRSFAEIIKDCAEGKTHFTYTINDDFGISMAPLRAPRLTKKAAEIVKVTLDNGEEIRCTPDHRFMRRDGTYREAQNLKQGDSLMPFYNRFYEGADPNLQGYEEVYNPSSNDWVFAHHLADAYNIETDVYSQSAGRVRHHKDFNKFNNDPRNIQRMAWAEHRHLHNRWLKELWNDPSFRDKILAAAMEKNILLHGTDEQRKAVTKAQKEWLMAMWQNPEYVSAQRERMRAMSVQMWKNPAHRSKISQIIRERMQSPENLAKASVWSKDLWSNPIYRSARSQQSKMQWQDPQYRAKHTVHLSSNGEKTAISRFITICKRALENEKVLTEDIYNKFRKDSKVKGIIRFEQGVSRYFKGDVKLLKAVCEAHHGRLNHAVVSVEAAGRADVYDLTVDGTHNFALANGVFVHNSIDGDSAAAYRYTEARLAKLAEEMLADIDMETVDFTPNFDGSTVEPVVLPSRTPNLLINGSDGIAVGMATKIPPHNLTEVSEALLQLIKNPELTVKDLMKYIPGPDFPTGAYIHGRDGIKQAYETGRGIIQMRALATIEPISRGDREAIVITEIPFQVNKARLIERIAELVSEGKIEGISDLRDESDRDGMRIVVELKKGTVAGVVLNQLYKHTAMQETFGVIMLAIVNGQPKVLKLKEMLSLFLDHRKEVVIRRTSFELKKAEERAHILAGLKIAVENIDEVIALIKKSKSPEEAKTALIKKFALSEIQSQAILEMRLQRLTGLERDKIIEDYKETLAMIKKLKEILASEKLIMEIVSNEIEDIKKKYGDKRRTEILAKTEDLTVEDLIAEEDMVVTVSHLGYIKRNPISIYRAQRRGGRGKMGMTTGDEDFVADLFIASTHNYVMIFTQTGKCFWLKVHEIPQIGRTAKGKAITNLVQMSSDDKIAAILPVRKFEDGKFVVLSTKKGLLKKTDLMEYSNPRASGIVATKIEEGDEVVSVRLTAGKEDIFITTKEGQSIRFKEDEVRATGRATYGVWGIELGKGDEVVAMETITNETPILTVTANGYGKRTELAE
ncbi:MAG: DNA gyrase subunit A, partial [Deltaproteobacteria bacterium]|nr:DNA gyrase subunit A [Deltaproteobacteria bacterium]